MAAPIPIFRYVGFSSIDEIGVLVDGVEEDKNFYTSALTTSSSVFFIFCGLIFDCYFFRKKHELLINKKLETF